MESLRLVFLLTWHLAVFGEALPSANRQKFQIIGGHPIDIKEVPYQVSLLGKDNFFFGAGSLVTKEFVMTAAMCVDPDLSQVRAGSNYTAKGGTVRDVERYYIHPKYGRNGYFYDIAIVKLEFPFSFTDTIKPIKIGDIKPKPESIVHVAGWGVTDVGHTSDVLFLVDEPVVNDTYCKESYNDIKNPDLVVCAVKDGKGSCKSDSGGGVTFEGKVVGIASFYYSCGVEDYPDVFTSTAQHEIRQFIKDVTGL